MRNAALVLLVVAGCGTRNPVSLADSGQPDSTRVDLPRSAGENIWRDRARLPDVMLPRDSPDPFCEYCA